MSRGVWILAMAMFVLVGCSSGGSGESGNVSSVPPSAINSTLIALVLPPGTTISSHADGVEIWQTPGSQSDAIAAVKPKLPIGQPLEGQKWCGETTDAKTGTVEWRWSGPAGSVDVKVLSDAELSIERSTKPATTCG
jgi:hypothetical protein